MTYEREKKPLLVSADSDATFAEEALRTHDGMNLAQEVVHDEERRFLFRFPLVKWKSFLVFLTVSLSLLFHWFSTSELFSIPEDVATSRLKFSKAKESYFQNSTYWDAKQRHFTEKLSEELSFHNDVEVLREIQEMPGEIFVSFLLKKLRLGLSTLEKTAVFSRDDTSSCSLIISKPENSIWPFSITLALEVEVKLQKERFSLSVSRLRRGTQDIALGLAWTYFGPELESIRQLESTTKQSFILLSKSEDLK